jgi:hypothetical protein
MIDDWNDIILKEVGDPHPFFSQSFRKGKDTLVCFNLVLLDFCIGLDGEGRREGEEVFLLEVVLFVGTAEGWVELGVEKHHSQSEVAHLDLQLLHLLVSCAIAIDCLVAALYRYGKSLEDVGSHLPLDFERVVERRAEQIGPVEICVDIGEFCVEFEMGGRAHLQGDELRVDQLADGGELIQPHLDIKVLHISPAQVHAVDADGEQEAALWSKAH